MVAIKKKGPVYEWVGGWGRDFIKGLKENEKEDEAKSVFQARKGWWLKRGSSWAHVDRGSADFQDGAKSRKKGKNKVHKRMEWRIDSNTEEALCVMGFLNPGCSTVGSNVGYTFAKNEVLKERWLHQS